MPNDVMLPTTPYSHMANTLFMLTGMIVHFYCAYPRLPRERSSKYDIT